MKKIYKIATLLLSALCIWSCTNLDEVWYSEVTPSTFYKTPSDVSAALFRPFTHAKWYVAPSGGVWTLEEETADQFCITVKGSDWYNGGDQQRKQYHTWTATDGFVWEGWRGTMMGIALALDTKNDLSQVDYTSLGLTDADKADNIAQLNTLIALFYLQGLDLFGPLPIYTSNTGGNIPRSKDVSVFKHIDALLDTAILNLKIKTPGSIGEGALTKAAAALLKARLYFNAKSYIRTDMYPQCKAICEDIISGKYGSYSLDADWTTPRGFNNNTSKEIIWLTPSKFNKLQSDDWWNAFMHYNAAEYFGISNMSGPWNGVGLQPSRKPDSTLYTDADWKLGRPYERFNDLDLRKKPYRYLGSTKYEGMFLVGPQINPNDPSRSSKDRSGEVINFRDFVCLKGSNISDIGQGEEWSTVRWVATPIPTDVDKSYRWGAGYDVLSLTEAIYMLAECDYRLGDKQAAADLFNSVRKRNFPNGTDPDPVTVANLDDYRVLQEWGTEFLGAGRRRTDLIRFGKFHTENWWDHKASGNADEDRFPVPTQAINGNNMLTDDPID